MITRFAMAGLIGLAGMAPVSAGAAEAAEKELIDLQHRWAAARMSADIAFLEQLYAPEFRITAVNGAVVERNADIAAFASGDLKPESIVNEDMAVSIYGDTAVVTGLEKVRGTYKGHFRAFVLRFTNVFVRREGRWQMVVHHSTEVRQPPKALETEETERGRPPSGDDP